MSVSDKVFTENKPKVPAINPQKGFFHSVSLTLSPSEVFEFFKNPEYIEKVFKDFPVDTENFLDLSLESAQRGDSDTYSVKWINKSSAPVQGHLTFLIEKAPANRGTYLTCISEFDKFKANDKTPSDFLLIFLKRMKQLVETGQIATTKGQPSGREELQTLH